MLTWQSVDGSVTRMWAVPNPDGTAQGMLTLYKGAFDGLQQPEDYARLLASKFAGVKDSMRHAIAERCAPLPVHMYQNIHAQFTSHGTCVYG